MNNYKKGRAYEYMLIQRLKYKGAIEVKRMAGSHGIFDIYALFWDRVELYQAKKTSEKTANFKQEIEEIKSLPPIENVKRFLAVYYTKNNDRHFYGWEFREV